MDPNASAKRDILETELNLVKILTNVKLVFTNVRCMPCVLTPLDHTAADAKKDLQEMEEKNANVSFA